MKKIRRVTMSMTAKRALKLSITTLIVLGVLSGSALGKSTAAKFAQLDPSYGVHGTYAVSTPKFDEFESVHLALAPDGEAYVLQGQTLLAFSPDGKPDRKFGKNGRIWVNPGPGQTLKTIGVAVDPAGRVLVAGTYIPSPGFYDPVAKGSLEFPPNVEVSEGFVSRYLADGTPDPTFGTGGVAITSFGVPRPTDLPFEGKPATAEYERPSLELSQLTVDPTGRPMVAGAYDSSIVNCGLGNRLVQSFAARLTISGEPDPSFGGSGYVDLPGGATGSIALGPGDEFAALSSPAFPCSEHSPGPGPYWSTSVLTEGGAPSPALDPARPTVGGYRELAIDPQGRILITERDGTPGPFGEREGGLKVVRLLPSGDLDTSFGYDGAANLKRFGMEAASIAVDGRARTVVAFGTTEPELIRISPAGKVETAFAKKGVFHATIERAASTEPKAVAIDSRGRIIVAGPASGGALKTGFGVGIARVLPPR